MSFVRLEVEIPRFKTKKNTYLSSKIDDSFCERWDKYVQQNQVKTNVFYHNTALLKTIQNTSHHTVFYFYVENSQKEILGVLPIIKMESKLFGKGLYSIPYFNYGGILADSPEIENKLILAVIELAKKINIDTIQLRESTEKYTTLFNEDDSSNKRFTCIEDKVNMILTLPSELKQVGLGNAKKRAKLRSQAKLAERKATELNKTLIQKFGGIELIDDFYTVFCENMRDLGTPVYGKYFFIDFLNTYKEYAVLSVVYWNGKPVSCAFLFDNRPALEIPWASTLKSMNKYSLNLYMYWNILEYAITQKFATFDFGRSSMDSGTYRFKKQFGAEPHQCYWYTYQNNDEVVDLSPKNKKFKLMIRIWKKLPVFITKIIGPSIVINLP